MYCAAERNYCTLAALCILPFAELQKHTLPIIVDIMKFEQATNGNFKRVSMSMTNYKACCLFQSYCNYIP